MAIYILVKKGVVDPCEKHQSIADAIADPYAVKESFYGSMGNQIDAGAYGAIQYNDNDGWGGSPIPIFITNISNLSATCELYIIDSVGSTIDFYNNSGGGPIVGKYMSIPSSTPFFVVVKNTGVGDCDLYDFLLSVPV